MRDRGSRWRPLQGRNGADVHAEITPLAPGVAMVTTLFQTRLVAPQGGGFAFGGALTMTLIERPDGWKILNGHSSSAVQRSG